MPNESTAKHDPKSKRELERQLERTRESLAETVGEIKETVQQEVKAVKKTVTGVLDYREDFAKDPLVWSLGALSAGFALGYTLGYAHKNSKGAKQSPMFAFADSLVEELSSVGQGLVMPALNEKIRELFGLEFSQLLKQMRGTNKPLSKKRTRKSPAKRISSKASKRTMKQAVGKK